MMSWLPSVYADAGSSAQHAGVLLAVSIIAGIPAFFLAPIIAGRLRHQGHLIGGLTALTGLGFKPGEASAAVAAASEELGAGATLDALVRVALKKAAK